MFAAAYRRGAHRECIDRHNAQFMADRTSFTRFRALRTKGSWDGGDPVMIACNSTRVCAGARTPSC
jgi:hypothetical protein